MISNEYRIQYLYQLWPNAFSITIVYQLFEMNNIYWIIANPIKMIILWIYVRLHVNQISNCFFLSYNDFHLFSMFSDYRIHSHHAQSSFYTSKLTEILVTYQFCFSCTYTRDKISDESWKNFFLSLLFIFLLFMCISLAKLWELLVDIFFEQEA